MRYITSIFVIAASLALSACGSTTTTASAPGISTINLQGGGATLSSLGGNGGSITIDSFSDVKIKADGAVATTFTVPAMSLVFGAVHVTVTGTTTVFVGNAPGAHPNGSLFVNPDTAPNPDMNLHRVTDQLGGSEIVTGLTVAAGATLVLPVNVTVTVLNAAALIFPNSVVIDGSLTTEVPGTNLYIEAGNAGPPSTGLLQVSSSGKVTTTGGGFLFLFSWGNLVNQGSLDASGLAGSSGGNAGFVELESFGFLYNTGKATAKGGDATVGSGGSGGNGNRIAMTAFNASLNTSGVLDNSGGTGDGSGNGGAGGVIYLLGGINDGSNPFGNIVSTAMGKVLVGGTLTSNGGQSQNGLGGSAASNGALALGPGIFLESEKSGQLLVNARIIAKGGATNGAAGGSGGTLNLNQFFGADLATGTPAPIEGIKLGSVIDLAGGAGVTGGAGGGMIIGNNFSPDALPSQSNSSSTAGLPIIELDGYSKIDLSGGDAGGTGGNAGTFHIYTTSPLLASLVFPAPAISNAVTINATGGAGTTTGGLGGLLDWQVGGNDPPPGAGYSNAFQEQLSVLESKGGINISGGDGGIGGTSGNIFFYGYTLKSTGVVSAKGGKGTVTGGNGPASLEMHATLNLTNAAAITATGGSGITGGNGGALVTLTAGNKVTNNGSILANGGAGTTTGGSGGLIDLQSEFRATANTVSLNVAKGAGPASGANGRVIVDFLEKAVPASGTVI